MKKIFPFIAILLFVVNSNSQQFEVGPLVGYWFDNIADYDSKSDKAVIGRPLWSANFGISAIYYFREPSDVMTYRIGLNCRNSNKGTVSRTSQNDRIEFNTNIFGLTGGFSRDIGKGYILYLDIGFSYNTINNNSIYSGNQDFSEAFPDLNEELYIKKNEFGFLYGFGTEKFISNSIKIFVEINGHAGISKINENPGNLRTQSLGIGTGIRYVFEKYK